MFPLAYGILYFANSGALVAFYRWYLAPMDNYDDKANTADASNVPTDDGETAIASIEKAEGEIELLSVSA